MFYLNFNNLDEVTQNQLLDISREDVEKRLGEQLKNYAEEHHITYDFLLEEETIRNLYNYKYMFSI